MNMYILSIGCNGITQNEYVHLKYWMSWYNTK